VNYSFGEPINFSYMGPAMFFAEELVRKYGVIFCGSAGNNGPGLQTSDAPSGLGKSILSFSLSFIRRINFYIFRLQLRHQYP
jgi:hypothetical protein